MVPSTPSIRAGDWLNLLSVDNNLAKVLRKHFEISSFDLTKEDILLVIMMASESVYYKTAKDVHPKYSDYKVDELLPHKAVWFQATPCGLELYMLSVGGVSHNILGLNFEWRHFLSEIVFFGACKRAADGRYELAIPVPSSHILNEVVSSLGHGGYDPGGVTQMGILTKYALAEKDAELPVRGIRVKTGDLGVAREAELVGPGGYRVETSLSPEEFSAWSAALRKWHAGDASDLAKLVSYGKAVSSYREKLALYEHARRVFLNLVRSDRSRLIDDTSVPLFILGGEAFIKQVSSKLPSMKLLGELKDPGLAAVLGYAEFAGVAIMRVLHSAIRANISAFPEISHLWQKEMGHRERHRALILALSKVDVAKQRACASNIGRLVAKRSQFRYWDESKSAFVPYIAKTASYFCVGEFGLVPTAANGSFHALSRIKRYAEATFESAARLNSTIEVYKALKASRVTQLY